MSRQGFTRSTTYEEPLASDKIRCYPNGGFGRIRDVCVIGRVGLQRRNFKGGSCLTYFKVDVVYLVVRISPGSEITGVMSSGGRDAGRCEAFDVRKSPHPDFAYLARTGSPATRCCSALSGSAAKSSQPAWFFAL
jgi:hypothetical protein